MKFRRRRSNRGKRDAALLQPVARRRLQKAALILVLLIGAYMGSIGSLARAVAKSDPQRAHQLSPNDGVIAALYAQTEFERTLETSPGSRSAKLARQALRADATAADALTVLGFQAQLRNEAKAADAAFAYSTKISRRELRPRIWAIEHAVTLGDIQTALRNYDIALRTSREAGDMLFPTLTAALKEPRIRRSLLRILATRPVWESAFVSFAASSALEPEGTMSLFSEGESIGLAVTPGQRAYLVNGLFAKGEAEKAWAYYSSFRRGVQRNRVRDPQFTLATDIPAVFDWQPSGDGRISASMLANGPVGGLDFTAPPNAGGAIVSQAQILAPGTYRLEGVSRSLAQRPGLEPYWQLTCADGRELGRVAVPASAQNEGRFAGLLIIPANCPAQTLSLIAKPTMDVMGLTGQIERVNLIPEL